MAGTDRSRARRRSRTRALGNRSRSRRRYLVSEVSERIGERPTVVIVELGEREALGLGEGAQELDALILAPEDREADHEAACIGREELSIQGRL